MFQCKITHVSEEVSAAGPGPRLAPHPVVLAAVLVTVGVHHRQHEHLHQSEVSTGHVTSSTNQDSR